MIKEITFPVSKVTVRKGLCTCLECRVYDKITGRYFSKTITDSKLSIAENKLFNLICNEKTTIRDDKDCLTVESEFVEWVVFKGNI